MEIRKGFSFHMDSIKIKISIYIIFSFHVILSQNLVPNASFEKAKPEPSERLTTKNSFTCEDWIAQGRPLYFTRKRKDFYLFSIPNDLGWQKPLHGEAYAGLVFWFGMGNKLSSYIEVKLKEKLIKNTSYCLSFFISMMDKSSYAINEFNYCLSKDNISSLPENRFIKSNEYCRIFSESFFVDTTNWVKLCSFYKAKGNESFLTIGGFNEYSDWKDLYDEYTNRKIIGAGYFIDSISLVKITDIKECDCNFKILSPPIVKSIILKNINFNQNESVLLPSSFKELDSLSSYLKQNPKLRVEISGHTDNSGTEVENLKLSEERAKTIANYISKKGIPIGRITYKGYGSSKPLKPNDNAKNKSFNRRVEFIIID